MRESIKEADKGDNWTQSDAISVLGLSGPPEADEGGNQGS